MVANKILAFEEGGVRGVLVTTPDYLDEKLFLQSNPALLEKEKSKLALKLRKVKEDKNA